MAADIRIFDTAEEISLFIVKKINDLFENCGNSGFITVGLSGGSTPKKIFECIASKFKDRADWNRILFFWGDERCVSPDSNESNFRMAKASLLDALNVPANNIFRIRGEDDPEGEARRYSHLVRHKVSTMGDIPSFDLLMLGLGEDGHTASIFPGNMELFISNRLFEATEHPSTGQARITATGKMVNHAKEVVFLVTGRSKAEIAAKVIEKKEGWEDLPAALVHPEKGQLVWLLDREAATNLKQYSRS